MTSVRARPRRPALRYHGGKWRIAPWIIGHLPAHHTYCEPYGGGMGVLLQKAPSPVEAYNDLSGRVVGFFRVLRERTDELIAAIQATPYARAEFEAARDEPWPSDELESARRLYILAWQGRGGPTARWNTGWRWQRTIANRQYNCASWDDTEHLWAVAGRLKHVQLDCAPGLVVIERYDLPTTCFYVDPPYLADTRSKWKDAAYDHEMSEEDHRELARALRGIRGMAVVSGYPHPLYDELYRGWTRVETASLTDVATTRTECLWISPAAAGRSRQLSLLSPAGQSAEIAALQARGGE